MGFGTLINDIVYKISGRVLSSSGLYVPSDNLYDYALGGIPFLSAASDTRPDIEGPIEQRKQQFDNYKDPGEYSLNQWWLRSQTSFIGGEGVVYQDPDTQGTAKNIRFKHSVGVDPFGDPDNLQLLKDSVNQTLAPNDTEPDALMFCHQFVDSDTEMCWFFKGKRAWMTTVDPGTLIVDQSVTVPGAVGAGMFINGIATIGDGVPSATSTTSEYAFAVYADDAGAASGVYRVANGFPFMQIVKSYIISGDLSERRTAIATARGQIALGINENFYMLDSSSVGAALPAAVAEVPTDQAIVAIADGPDAIYVAANSHYAGYIYKTTFDATTGVVNGLTLSAILPAGELINDLDIYVNTYLVTTTTTGVRVGTFGGDAVNYGPSIITVPRVGVFDGPDCGSGFGRIAFYGTRAYVTTQGTPQHDGDFGLMAIDLGTLIQDTNTGATFNAYATWDYVPGTTTAITDVTATPSGRLIYTTDSGANGHPILEHRDNLISQGYLDTGRCRFNTVEPKLFKYMSIRTPGVLNGEITVSIIDQNDGVTSYQTFGPTLDPGTNDISTPVPAGPQNWISLRFTLKRGLVDPTIGAKLDSWQIKALPGTLKQRKIIRQFLCFNTEKDKAGQWISGDLASLDRLTAVRQMCQRGDTVTLQDLVNNISDQVVIDDYQFTMLAPPGPNGENYGGYLTITMRTVADNVPPLSFAGVDEED
jgi:hypothetical protein